MTCVDKLNKIKIDLDSLGEEIKQSYCLSGNAIVVFSNKMIQLRKQLENFKEDQSLDLFQTSCFENLGICEKRLNQLQSKLIKKSLPLVEKNEEFYKKITEVWTRVTSGVSADPELGKRLATNKKKDPVVLQALNEHLRIKNISDFIEFCKYEQNKEIILAVYKQLDPRDRKGIEDAATEILSNKTSLESGFNTETFLSSAISQDVIIKAAQGYLNRETIQSEDATKPFIHHRLTPFLHQALEIFENSNASDEFYMKVNDLYEQETQQEIKDEHFAKKFIQQNKGHPIVIKAVSEFIFDQYLSFLVECIENEDWDSAEEFYSTIPAFIRTEIEKKVKNSKISHPNFKKGLEEYQGELEQRIKNAEEFPQRGINQIKGLFYSVSTIIDDQSNIDPQLASNLQLAYEAMTYAIRKVQYSSNFFDREDTRFNIQNFTSDQLKKLTQEMKLSISSLVLTKIEELNSKTKDIFNAIGKTAEIYPLGNCRELSGTARSYLDKQKVSNVDTFQIQKRVLNEITKNQPGGDHGFDVIGRDEKSDPNDYKSWGPNAVVCDPWMRMIYPASLIGELMRDYMGISPFGTPKLKPFDTKFHVLVLDTGL